MHHVAAAGPDREVVPGHPLGAAQRMRLGAHAGGDGDAITIIGIDEVILESPLRPRAPPWRGRVEPPRVAEVRGAVGFGAVQRVLVDGGAGHRCLQLPLADQTADPVEGHERLHHLRVWRRHQRRLAVLAHLRGVGEVVAGPAAEAVNVGPGGLRRRRGLGLQGLLLGLPKLVVHLLGLLGHEVLHQDVRHLREHPLQDLRILLWNLLAEDRIDASQGVASAPLRNQPPCQRVQLVHAVVQFAQQGVRRRGRGL
mmetsp:Transcript_143751/g.250916  ORF Transcript_143751/g.250916 Transcript_143751/m.250916 type:complete len:254 (-) Transcript_143751:2040-2801(-)